MAGDLHAALELIGPSAFADEETYDRFRDAIQGDRSPSRGDLPGTVPPISAADAQAELAALQTRADALNKALQQASTPVAQPTPPAGTVVTTPDGGEVEVVPSGQAVQEGQVVPNPNP